MKLPYEVVFYGFAALTAISGYLVRSKLLPPPKPTIVGIDLGTTYSCVAAFHAGQGLSKGRVEVLRTEGQRVVPSVVSYGADGAVLVGRRATARASLDPANTIYDAKRFIGLPHAVASKQPLAYPYQIAAGADGGVRFRVMGGKRLVSPEEVGGEVLKYLRRGAEASVGRQVHKCVMSVPAEFGERQRNATMAAASLAGLEVLRVISEPTAAALAYGLQNVDTGGLVVVFDFGGGTLDVSLLGVESGMFLTLAISGDSYLGGQDLSHNLMEHVREQVLRHSGAEALSAQTQQRLGAAVEEAKIKLSRRTATTVQVRLEPADYGGAAGPGEVAVPLTRAQFVAINAEPFGRLLLPLRQVLKDLER